MAEKVRWFVSPLGGEAGRKIVSMLVERNIDPVDAHHLLVVTGRVFPVYEVPHEIVETLDRETCLIFTKVGRRGEPRQWFLSGVSHDGGDRKSA